MNAEDGCPYGASECPKIESIEKVLAANSQEIYQLKQEIVSLESTIKTVGLVIGMVVTLVAGIIGILFC